MTNLIITILSLIGLSTVLAAVLIVVKGGRVVLFDLRLTEDQKDQLGVG